METGEDTSLFDLVLKGSLRDRRALTRVLVATYRVELTQALRAMASRRAQKADLDRVFSLAAQIVAVSDDPKMREVRCDAEALERTAAAAHLGGVRRDGEIYAAGLRVIERILAAYPDRDRPPVRAMN